MEEFISETLEVGGGEGGAYLGLMWKYATITEHVPPKALYDTNDITKWNFIKYRMNK